MGKYSKKIGRKKQLDSEKEMASKVGLFGKIGNSCVVCDKPFDKTDKEMVKEIQENLSERTKK